MAGSAIGPAGRYETIIGSGPGGQWGLTETVELALGRGRIINRGPEPTFSGSGVAADPRREESPVEAEMEGYMDIRSARQVRE